MRNLKDKKALVTGAAGGIGRALVRELARQGCAVWATDLDAAALEDVCDEARSLGVEVAGDACDLADLSQIAALADRIRGQWGGVDILVNNAGVLVYGNVKHVTAAQWQRVLAVNLHAPVELVRQFLPDLLDRPEAHILNVASMYGLVGIRNLSTYQTTKYALVGLSESLRADLRRTNVGVTALCPSFVKTSLTQAVDNANPRRPIKPPPDWLCVTAQRVAREGVLAIRRNRGLVVVGWPAWLLWGAWRLSPRLYDWLRSFL